MAWPANLWLRIVLFLVVSTTVAHSSDRFDPILLKSVLRIETSPNANGYPDIGGGFLMSATEDAAGKVFLITNKHMIGDWNYADADFHSFKPWINVFFYRVGDPSGQTFRATRIDLLKGAVLDGAKVHLHLSPRIDLVAIDVTDRVRNPQEHIDLILYGPSYLLPFGKIKDQDTTIADQVIALGYPLGIRSLRNDYPIAKMGYLASTPGEEVVIPIRQQNRAGVPIDVTIDGKFLVVDGLIVPGNSGGPVVIAGGMRVRRDPATNQIEYLDRPLKNLVVGVVSYALGGGLTVVVSSDYLLELLQLLTSPR